VPDIIQFWDNPVPGSNFQPPIRQAWRRMQKSLRSPEYARLIAALIAARKDADVRQQALAKKLGRPQSFIAKYEGGERRIDVVEFVAIVRALGADPIKVFGDFVTGMPASKAKRKTLAK
jgi:ribosome-binding protein aMBF1 (putative translation factor)